MVRILSVMALVGAVWMAATEAQAKRMYGMAGCGLGSTLMGAEGGQISAATTNGTAANQSFGITSGTSNCVDPKMAAMIEEQEQFVAYNLNTLSKEMAQGSGDSLTALSEKLGCSSEVYSDFASQLQSDYDVIFAAPGAVAVLNAAKQSLNGQPALSSNCKFISI